MFSKQCYFLGENQSYDYFQRLRVWKCVSSRRGYKISDNFWQQKPLKWPRSLFDLEVPVWGTTVGQLRRQSAFRYASGSHGQQRRPPKPALGLPMPVTCLGDRHERVCHWGPRCGSVPALETRLAAGRGRPTAMPGSPPADCKRTSKPTCTQEPSPGHSGCRAQTAELNPSLPFCSTVKLRDSLLHSEN